MDDENLKSDDKYKIEFNFYYIEFTNFKEKELLILRHVINGARIGQYLSFDKYANISFSDNDTKHINPCITELNSFTRGKTNCIIFNMKNVKDYDKCLVYQTLFKNDGFYGYIFYNSETHKYKHIYNVSYDLSLLLNNIVRSIDSLYKEDMFNYYMTRTTDGVRKYRKYGCFPNCPPADKMNMSVNDILWQ